jgi:hypothetical protein
MVKDSPANFVCPGCQARYKVVRVRSELRSRDFPLHCKVCKQPLAATDGEDILKYFLIRRPKERQAQTHFLVNFDHGRCMAARGTLYARARVMGFYIILRARRLDW